MTSWIERKCTERGLRMTDQRKVIAKVLSEANDHPDAEDLYSRASAIDPKISLATNSFSHITPKIAQSLNNLIGLRYVFVTPDVEEIVK